MKGESARAVEETKTTGAHELLRRGGNFHMIPVASGTGPELELFTNEPLTGFDVRITTHPGDLVRTWIYGPVWQGYWHADLGSERPRDPAGRGDPARQEREGDHVARRRAEGRRRHGGHRDVRDVPLLGHGNGLFWERPTIWLDVEENEERWTF